MRILILIVLMTQIITAQTKFKNIHFGTGPVTSRLPENPKKIPLATQKGSNASSIDYKTIPFTLFSPTDTGAIESATLDINTHSFWAETSQTASFNLRSANSSVHSFINQFKSKLHIKNSEQEFKFISKETDDLGYQHIRVQQEYQGIPIYGGELIIHGKGDEMQSVNGYAFSTPTGLTGTPSKSNEELQSIIIQDLKSKNKFKEVSDELLKLTNARRISQSLTIYYNEKDIAHLASYVTIKASGLETWVYLIDAHTGQILKSFKNTCSFLPHNHSGSFVSDKNTASIHDIQVKTNHRHTYFDFAGKTTSSATDLFGKNITLQTYQDGNFYLVDASRQMFKSIGTDNEEPTGVIWTFDGKNSSPAFKSFNPALINSTSNTGWISPSAASAHFNAGLAYEYFLSKHSRNSINGQGGNIISLINVLDEDGKQMDNAFWDGEAMYYGNGKDAFTPLAKATDVAGHEMSHGVIQTTANLDYDSESGALNESFADIFGRLIDRDDWTIGEDVVKKSIFPTGALRSFIDPHNGGSQLGDAGYQPRTYAERYRGSEDNSGVHINSGIPNWAFYQFVTRINNDLDKAERIYYRALTRYLTRSSRFIDCRKAVIQAATDLHGASSAEVTAAKAAYDFVGIVDGASTNTQTDVVTNTGKNFIVYADDAQSNLFIADETGRLIANPLTTKDPLSKPSVTDDGSGIVFVGKDKKIHYVLIDWAQNKITEEGVLQNEAIWRNAIISKEGNLLAAIKDVKENIIHVFDFNAGQSGQWKQFELYNPTFSNGVKTGAVNYADAMEFNHTGESIMYDAINTIKNAAGADVEYWDISFLRVYTNSKKSFGDGKVTKLFGQLPEKTSVGNPTFSKNSPYIIAMDYIVNYGETNETYLLAGANTETGKLDTILVNKTINWPNYSTADDKVIFNAETTSGTKVVGQIKLTNSKIRGAGTASALINPGKLGTWFGTGDRKLDVNVSNELVYTYGLRLYPNPVVSDELRIEWKQPVHGDSRIYIYDITGRLKHAYKYNYQQGNQIQTIAVKDLTVGMYLIKMESGDKTGTLRFVKQ